MAEQMSWEDLPEECWESIVHSLDHHRHLESFSLVCKRFLSLSDRLRSRLTLSGPSLPPFSHLSLRFPNLRRIDFTDPESDLSPLLLDLSRSQLKLESLLISNHRARFPAAAVKELGLKMNKTLKSFTCTRFKHLEDSDLAIAADSFPSLEELDISYPDDSVVTDEGIRNVSLKLKRLRAIHLSGNPSLTDKSLFHLFSNCCSLSEIAARDCAHLTQTGVASSIRGTSNAGLSSLDLSLMFLQDDVLFQISEVRLKLRKLALSRCKGFTFAGISRLLQAYHHSLHHLDLEGAYFLTDELVSNLGPHLRNLRLINISSCCYLTNWAFFHLVQTCPSLEEIRMERTNLGEGSCADRNSLPNNKITALKLGWNRYLCDDMLKSIGTACPKLISLDLSYCSMITGEGIREFGRSCSEIKELEINGCYEIEVLCSASEFPKLEVLRAVGSGIGDEWLSLTGKCCENLWSLELGGCLGGVTDKGVKQLVKKTKSLRYLNLENCFNVSLRAEVLDKMAISRPWPMPKKIVLPFRFHSTGKQRDCAKTEGFVLGSWTAVL